MAKKQKPILTPPPPPTKPPEVVQQRDETHGALGGAHAKSRLEEARARGAGIK